MSCARDRALLAATLASLLVGASSTAVGQPNCVGSGDPVVLVHGINSDGGTWASFDQYLRSQMNVTVCRPTLGEARPLAVQADTLVSRYAALSTAPILVGHSQGGLVAREASKNMAARALITIGTPHGGAPIAARESDVRWWDELAFFYAFDIVQAWVNRATESDPFDDPPYDRHSDVRYVLAGLATAGAAAGSAWTQGLIGHFLNGQASLQDLAGHTSFLGALNSPANLARESTAIPIRVGLVSDAGQYDPFVGPFALVGDPSSAFSAMAGAVSLGYLIYDYGVLLSFDVDFGSSWWFSDLIGVQSALSFGYMLFSLPEAWCTWIDGCPNDLGDFIVPFLRQWYPGAGAQNVVISYGPTHNRETTDSEVESQLSSRIALVLSP